MNPTPRQVECIRALVIEGGYAGAARRMGVSRSTFSHHLEEARRRLGVDTSAQAVAVLALSGLLSRP